MRLKVAAAAALVLLAGAALRVAMWRPSSVAGQAPDDGFVRVPGVVHVHTTLSDGSGTPDEVIRAARAAGAKFIVITDHNNVDAKSVEGYHDGVLVIAGSELSTTSGHIVGLGIEDPTYRFSGDPLDGLEDIRDLGGFPVAAHPMNPRADLQFTGWDLPGPWGVELVNGDSEWRTAGWRALLTPALYGLNRRYALLHLLNSPGPTLARWDRLLADRDVAGVAGTDAHGGFLSYESLFSLMRNYLVLTAPLTGRFDEDRRAVLDALRHGRSYIGIDGLADAGGFSFVAEAPGHRWTMGDTVAPAAGLRLKAGGRVPAGSTFAARAGRNAMTRHRGRWTSPYLAPVSTGPKSMWTAHRCRGFSATRSTSSIPRRMRSGKSGPPGRRDLKRPRPRWSSTTSRARLPSSRSRFAIECQSAGSGSARRIRRSRSGAPRVSRRRAGRGSLQRVRGARRLDPPRFERPLGARLLRPR